VNETGQTGVIADDHIPPPSDLTLAEALAKLAAAIDRLVAIIDRDQSAQ
jgi:hypothetical protein